MINQEYLKSILNYNEDTGNFLWKHRTISHFKDNRSMKIWNSRFSGSSCGYINNDNRVMIRIDGILYPASRLAWIYTHNEIPDTIDHIDGNTLNNSLSNLRNVSQKQNCSNLKLRDNNKARITGVWFCKSRKRFVAQIKNNYRLIHLGRHKTLFEAACARKSAEIKYDFHENHGQR